MQQVGEFMLFGTSHLASFTTNVHSPSISWHLLIDIIINFTFLFILIMFYLYLFELFLDLLFIIFVVLYLFCFVSLTLIFTFFFLFLLIFFSFIMLFEFLLYNIRYLTVLFNSIVHLNWHCIHNYGSNYS